MVSSQRARCSHECLQCGRCCVPEVRRTRHDGRTHGDERGWRFSHLRLVRGKEPVSRQFPGIGSFRSPLAGCGLAVVRQFSFGFRYLMLQLPSYARTGRLRAGRSCRTSVELTRCQSQRTDMPTIFLDRSSAWSQPACTQRRAARVANRFEPNADTIAEWEFSDAMRSARFPAGWFVLPSAALSLLLLFALVH